MEKRFLLGHGERLTSALSSPRMRPAKNHPYASRDEVYERLLPKYQKTRDTVLNLAPRYCPNDETVFCIDLHPAYISKSYFPERLLRKLDLRPIGSRTIHLIPQKSTGKSDGENQPSLEIFVAANKRSVEEMEYHLRDEELFMEMREIEDIRPFMPGERLKGDWKSATVFEVVLHAKAIGGDYIVSGLKKLAACEGLEFLDSKRIYASDLCFIPVKGEAGYVDRLEPYSFLRAARSMPKLRDFPVTRGAIRAGTVDLQLPMPPVQSNLKVAVFDSGCHVPQELEGWVNYYSWPSDIETDKELLRGLNHGSMVNSALLFGSIDKQSPLVPVVPIDHYRVLNENENNDFELYDALDKIIGVLDSNKYDFANLSIGPAIPVDDDDVHVWTAVLDEKLSEGNTLLTVAAGNNGEMDVESGNARIQVPSDSVNALTIGASTLPSDDPDWQRAPYSAIGPGRSPGRIKPDLLAFGGSVEQPFILLEPNSMTDISGYSGTSFAAPNALRLAIALKHRFSELTPMALKCLLVHKANRKAMDVKLEEHGWGCLSEKPDNYALCDDNSVTILFQGTFKPSKYMKAPIPVPPDPMSGKVTLTATFCYSTTVDAKDPSNYTRSGLEVKLRPKMSKASGQDENRPDTKPFFDADAYAPESKLRSMSLKWETVLHGEKTFLASSIEEPFFEVHYLPRSGGASTSAANSIPYALLVTLTTSKEQSIYDRVALRYKNLLSPIQETLPVQVKIQ